MTIFFGKIFRNIFRWRFFLAKFSGIFFDDDFFRNFQEYFWSILIPCSEILSIFWTFFIFSFFHFFIFSFFHFFIFSFFHFFIFSFFHFFLSFWNFLNFLIVPIFYLIIITNNFFFVIVTIEINTIIIIIIIITIYHCDRL